MAFPAKLGTIHRTSKLTLEIDAIKLDPITHKIYHGIRGPKHEGGCHSDGDFSMSPPQYQGQPCAQRDAKQEELRCLACMSTRGPVSSLICQMPESEVVRLNL